MDLHRMLGVQSGSEVVTAATSEHSRAIVHPQRHALAQCVGWARPVWTTLSFNTLTPSGFSQESIASNCIICTSCETGIVSSFYMFVNSLTSHAGACMASAVTPLNPMSTHLVPCACTPKLLAMYVIQCYSSMIVIMASLPSETSLSCMQRMHSVHCTFMKNSTIACWMDQLGLAAQAWIWCLRATRATMPVCCMHHTCISLSVVFETMHMWRAGAICGGSHLWRHSA